MPRARDLLYRFRPAGTPGAASATGVPADRAADLAAELQSLFADLADTQRECAELIRRADDAAAATRAADAEQARSRVASARERAGAERAAAGAPIQQRGQAAAAERRRAAQQRADEFDRHADKRISAFIDPVLTEVIGILDESPHLEQPPARRT
jgi:hypothetical protein